MKVTDRYRAILEATPIGHYVVDRAFTLRYANPALVRDFGDTLEKRCYEYLYGRSEPCPWCFPGNVLDHGETMRWEHTTDDGRILELTRQPFVDEDGETCQLGTVIDVSSRKETQEALLKSTHILEAYNCLLDAGIVSESSRDFLRRSLDVLASLNWLQVEPSMAAFVMSSDATKLLLAAHRNLNERIIETCAEVPVGHCVCGRAAAARTPLRTTEIDELHDTRYEGMSPHGHIVIPLETKDEVLGVLNLYLRPGSSLDPLQEHFLEGVVSIMAGELYRRRSEEHQEHLEAQFRQSQKMEAIGRLAGGVAHDFNNVLTAITSFSELGLLKVDAEDPLHHYFEEIVKSADRAADLTRHLLAFSRRQILEPRVIRLDQVVAEMGKMLRRLLGEDVDLEIAEAASLSPVLADPGQIEQVVVNLAVNSRDAMPGGGRLSIEFADEYLDKRYVDVHPMVQPGRYVRIAMSDTGVGMSEAVQARIFEPFFTTKAGEGGTGLGLSTVYGIVKQSGGYVWVYSEEGEGTTFKIYLPAVEGDVTSPRVRQPEGELPRGTETILVAEDDETVRGLITDILESLGYTVLAASEGSKALALAREHDGEIHLLLSDVVMPRMSGKELYDRIQAQRPSLPVLYISGYTDNAIVHHGVLAEGTPFLQKPFSPGKLAARVRGVLDGQG